ncbi:GGDEF domain-containing protein [Mycobacterium parmense]|uniref:Uncharacterized protein n=1 Tax=Mycobacterium parmense TaxID=185642 RepID=A0A7I7YTN6_9MYCO|nr:GGDEF domain-containing protein [Mycobacterium parmense]MCV7351316.1 GGDEF domain-containing protein [Mycobacterium parmense]ORW60841.1 hypothetical protein AWC20_07860 [Mycobacterium parmense]BBZ45228.1 hypothetical protein MPRM_25090 [Mycobacterium parmense]
MSWFKAMWSQPDQYDWVTSFLRQRGMLPAARLIMVVVAGSAVVLALIELSNQIHPLTTAGWVNAATAVYAFGMVMVWLARWPTRRQSQVVLVAGVLCIGGWVVAEPNPSFAALACTATSVTAGYSAVFHGVRLLLLHSVVAVAISAVAVLRLSHQTDLPVASAFWLINFVMVSVSLGFWGMSRGIQMYADRSDQDALTGLLNRRALVDAIRNRLANPRLPRTHLAVLMVDLDNFKRLNDTLGHLAGDDALRAEARLLREHAPDDAVICRAGGEEFLVAVTTVSVDLRALAVRICTAIAGLSPQITASVGTASAELHSLTEAGVASLVERLIGIADAAMYAAKRSGGNQVQHA